MKNIYILQYSSQPLKGELIRDSTVFQSDLNTHYNRLFTSEAQRDAGWQMEVT